MVVAGTVAEILVVDGEPPAVKGVDAAAVMPPVVKGRGSASIGRRMTLTNGLVIVVVAVRKVSTRITPSAPGWQRSTRASGHFVGG